MIGRQYPDKVLLAWGEAISGNADLKNWLMANDFPELGLFVHALHLDAAAREWLMAEGHPELMALCRGAEGEAQAVEWLKNHRLGVLADMALAADNDDEAMARLLEEGHALWAGLALKIRSVKNGIESRHNDWHTYNRD